MKPTGGITGALVENGYLYLPDLTNNNSNYVQSNNMKDNCDDKEIHIHLTININSDINKESAKIISDNINKLIKFK